MFIPPQHRIAVLLPCYNEAAGIDKVVAAFKEVLPTATIYVYDNNSTDDTAEVALSAGAIVRCELNRGKGNVVRRMFSDIEADIYVMADGDETYDSTVAPELITRRYAYSQTNPSTTTPQAISYQSPKYALSQGKAKQISNILQGLNNLYGKLPAAKFTPAALKAVRRHYLERKLSRTTINGYIG